jgi:thiamine kinase-like enzyme
MTNINLNRGLSGCSIEFDKKLNIVKKTSSSKSYNHRLENQINKQFFLSNFSINGIDTPSILSVIKEDLFYFNMQYISGQNPFDIFIYGSKSEIDNFIQSIINYFNFTLSSKKDQDIYEFKIKTKQKLSLLYDGSKYKDFINFLIIKTENTTSKTFYKSFCHGDLTISNMIIKNNTLYLIDFLDSFIDSPIIDIAKLKQDLFYNWSLDNIESYTNQDLYRANQVSKFIWNKVSSLYMDIIETTEFDVIESLNFLRIEPYISNDMKNSLDKIIKSLKLYEEFNNTNGR